MFLRGFDKCLSVHHESAFSGYLGAKKTEVRILLNFFWPGVCQDVLANWISSTILFSSACISSALYSLLSVSHLPSFSLQMLLPAYNFCASLQAALSFVLLLLVSELELILILAPFSLILLKNAGFLPTVISKVILGLIYFKSIQPVQFILICITDEPPINITTRKNQPSSYRFTLANQRNSWTILDWTSQNPLIVAFE